MTFVTDKRSPKKKAFLVGIQRADDTEEHAYSLLEELMELVSNLGMEVVGTLLVRIRQPQAAFFMGKGKVEEVLRHAKAHQSDVIVFDDELTPAQQRNWEKESGVSVVDRQGITIDIFDQRAQTKEARLQVELAYLEYIRPRLKRAWTHLSRQRGGGVTQRGTGETQLEIDQRMVNDRIAKVKLMLKEVVQHRDLQRKKRLRVPLPTAAIVGYTNAGKSSLLNTLTAADVVAEDKLFATLDPTTRRVKLKSGQGLLLTDTVGFVRRLPHRLIEAFKATLEEALYADFLIHLVDASSPDIEEHIQTTQEVLLELGADKKKVILAFNKVDLLQDEFILASLKASYPNAVFISAHTELGLPELYDAIEEKLKDLVTPMHLLIPYTEHQWVQRLHEAGAVQKEDPQDTGTHIFGYVPNRWASKLACYQATKPKE